MAMDRYLYLWQIASNGNEYVGGSQYKPFPKAAACGAKIKSCGVSYGSHKTGSQNKKSTSLKAMRAMSDDEVALELLGSIADTSGDDPMTPQVGFILVLQNSQAGGQASSLHAWGVAVHAQ